jgi:hypothetical protein
MAEQTPLDRWSSKIVMRTLDIDEAAQLGGVVLRPGCRERGASAVPGSERPTGLRDMEESNHGYD